MLTHHPTRRLKYAQKGQSLVEYALALVLVSLVSIIVLGLIGSATSRNVGVVTGTLGGKKNASGSPGAGTKNTIYITANTVICHIVTTGNIGTYVYATFETSTDIALTDIAYSLGNVIVNATPSNIGGNTGGTNPYTATALKSATADALLCPKSIVITGKNGLAIMPVVSIVAGP